jgi:hypothetical protein
LTGWNFRLTSGNEIRVATAPPKGSGDDFRRGLVDAYKAMTEHMPDNGMQCVMLTHQDTGVRADMVGIFGAGFFSLSAASVRCGDLPLEPAGRLSAPPAPGTAPAAAG